MMSRQRKTEADWRRLADWLRLPQDAEIGSEF
jgi:hypothetical protein